MAPRLTVAIGSDRSPASQRVMMGRFKAMGVQPLADHFAAKYHWNEAEEARVDRVLRTALPTGEERSAAGRALREKVRRGALGRWRPAEDRPDPVDLIEDAHEGRLQRLVPVRVGRMAGQRASDGARRRRQRLRLRRTASLRSLRIRCEGARRTACADAG